MAATTQARNLFPARFFMRPFQFDLGSGLTAFALGGAQVKVPLRPQGYLDSLVVHLTGTYTVANAALVAIQLGLYNVVQNFTLNGPNRPKAMFNLGGTGMHWWNLRDKHWAPGLDQVRFPAQGTLDANAYWAGAVDQFPVALGAETFALWWVLPATYDAADIRGTLPLGNTTNVNLLIQPAAAADFVDVAANLTLFTPTLDVEQVWLAPPPAGAPIIPTTSAPNADGVDVDWEIAYDENSQAIVASGNQKVALTPEYTFLGIMHAVTYATAGAGAQLDMTDIETMQLKLNSQLLFPDGPYPFALWYFHSVYQHRTPMPFGCLLYDRDVLGRSDWIYTDQLTEMESDIALAAAAMGTNPQVYTWTKLMIDNNPAAHLLAAG